MIEIAIPRRNNFVVSVVNENGVKMVARVHTFRGITYLSEYAGDVLVIGSVPAIGNSEVGNVADKKRYGTFFWKLKYSDSEYPYMNNFVEMVDLYFIQPSEYRDV